MLLAALHRAAIALDQDFRVISADGPELPLLKGPVQVVRMELRKLGDRAALRAVERERPEFEGVGWADTKLAHTLRATVARKKRLAANAAAADHDAARAPAPEVPDFDHVAPGDDDQRREPRRRLYDLLRRDPKFPSAQ